MAGRKPIEFDSDKVEIFGMFRANYQTMADYFGCSHDTIERNLRDPESPFCVSYKRGMANGKLRLYEAQMKKAEGFHETESRVLDGNIVSTSKYYPPDSTMLIWLGKNLLAQSDDAITDDDDISVTFNA